MMDVKKVIAKKNHKYTHKYNVIKKTSSYTCTSEDGQICYFINENCHDILDFNTDRTIFDICTNENIIFLRTVNVLNNAKKR